MPPLLRAGASRRLHIARCAALVACLPWLVACGGPTPAPSSQPNCSFDVTPKVVNAPAGGGAALVTVVASARTCGWSYASAAEWVKVGPSADATSTPGTGSGVVEVLAVANAGASSRQATVTVAGAAVLVTQGGTAPTPGCTYTVSPASSSFAAAGGSGSFTVSAGAGCTWSADITASSEDFVTIVGGRDGNGTGTLAFTVRSNTTGSARSGDIAVLADFGRQRLTHLVQQSR